MKTTKRRSHMLGIALEEHWCSVVLVEHTAGGSRVVKAQAFSMGLDVLKDSPELVGAELQRHLAEARISERSCIAIAPTNWFLTAQVAIPEMDLQDEASYLELQAEHLIPVAPGELLLRSSVFRTQDGSRHATLLALPTNRASKVLEALRHARLHPLGLGCSSAILTDAHNGPNAVLQFGRERVDLAIAAGGGLVALRTLREAGEMTPGILSDVLSREIQITLRQLSKSLAEQVRSITVYGHLSYAGSCITELQGLFRDLGLTVHMADKLPGDRQDIGSIELTHVSPAAVVAAMQALEGRPPTIDFLTVRPSRVHLMAKAILKRRALSIAAGTLAGGMIVTAAILLQHYTLRRLTTEHDLLAPKAEAARALQDRIRAYRDWCDSGSPTLQMTKALTEAFPESGDIWLRTLGIQDLTRVTCAGSARSNQAFLSTLDALGVSPGVSNLKVAQMRGDTQLDFNFSYTWEQITK